jgi:hypothetical protein
MIRTAIAVLAALILVPASAGATDNLAGQASIIDGDTLEIHGTRIRLWGIDAPESDQLSGTKTANTIVAGRNLPMSLMPLSRDARPSALKLIATNTGAPLLSARSPVST